MAEKIGVYVCHCGSNIAGVVDVAGVAKWAEETLPNVRVARDYKFMCSSLGQEMIEKDIKDLQLTRVVVAACSPHLHETTFRNACKRAGLNPYLFANRNHFEQVRIQSGAFARVPERRLVQVRRTSRDDDARQS